MCLCPTEIPVGMLLQEATNSQKGTLRTHYTQRRTEYLRMQSAHFQGVSNTVGAEHELNDWKKLALKHFFFLESPPQE